MGSMKISSSVLVLSVVFACQAWAGTFTTTDTRIPVPAQATATEAGDTSPATIDTIHLDARVYLPDQVAAPAPVLLVIPPYNGTKDSATAITLASDFASQGYVVVTPTVRGFGNSEGLVSLVGPDEVNDLKTIILAMQTGAIGDSPAVAIPVSASSKFGVTGASYGGGHSFEIVRTHVAGLVAVAPIIGWTDLYQALAPNDVPKLSYTVGLFAGGFNAQNPNYDDVMFDWLQDLLGGHPEDARTGGPQSNIDWRSVIFDPAELTLPVFVIQGWRDWLFPGEQATSLFETTTSIPFFKLYIGGLGHAPGSTDIGSVEALFLRQQLIRWFEYWLKGIDTGIISEPRVTVAPEGTANWSETGLITANTFPIPGTVTNTYFLKGRKLFPAPPTKGRRAVIQPTTGIPALLQPIQNALGGNASGLIAAVTLVNGLLNSGGDILSPNIVTDVDTSANLRTFTTPRLTQNVHVVGLPVLHLFVSASDADAEYYVQIIEISRTGAHRLVSRGAFRDHTAAFNTPHEIVFSPFAINHVFNTGNKIRIQVSSRDFPFFLPNFSQPPVKILRDPAHASHVALPVVP